MGESAPETPERPDWLQPGTYSVWAYERDGENEPILLVAYEWEASGLCGVRVAHVWLHEDEAERDWEKLPEFDKISAGTEAALFAGLIERGKVHRIGSMPPIGQYTEQPSWLT